MRVLHVIPTLAARTGGPPTAVVQSSLALRRIGVECTIYATDMAEAAGARAHRRITLDDMPQGADSAEWRLFAAKSPRRLAFSPALFRALDRDAAQYDVVHIHSLFLFPQFAAYWQARRYGVPYVVSPRGALDPHLRRRGRLLKSAVDHAWQRRMLDGAAAIHVTSDEEARLIADVAPRVRRDVIPNGIRWKEFQSLPDGGEFRARHGIASNAPLVMYLGRLSHKKGIDVLIRSLAIVRRTLPDVRLAICGPDDEGLTTSLLAVVRREGLAGDVVFTGMLNGQEKLAALAAADVWVLPSHTENFGIAVVEAMAAGVPVVVSPEVNIAHEIEASHAGIVAPRAALAFAEAICGVLSNRELAAELSERGRGFARRYDWHAVAPRMASMYERIARRDGLRIAA